MILVRQCAKVNQWYKQWLIFRNTLTATTVNGNATHQNNRSINTNTFNAQHILRSLDSKIQRIDYYARNVGRVRVGQINDMFKDIKRLPQSSPPSYSHSLLLIRCCGSLLSEVLPSTRNHLVNKIFDFLSNSTKLYISHYNSLLQVYLDNEYEFNPLDILNKMEERGIEPNRVTYQRLIHRYCQIGDIEGATKILEFMKSKQIPINEYVFNSLILGYGKAGDLESAYNTLELMKKSGLEPTGDTYTSLLCAYALNAKNPDAIKKIPELIEEANRNEIALTESDYLELIKILAQIDSNLPLIDELIKTIPKTESNRECMKAIFSLCHNKQFYTSFKLYDTMIPPTLQVENKTVGNVFILQLIKANAPTDLVLNLSQKLKDNGLNDLVLNRAAKYAVQYADVDSARVYLKKFAEEFPLRIHFYWPLLVRSKTEDQIFELISEDINILTNVNYSSLHETFADYVFSKPISDVELFINKCKAIHFSCRVLYNALLDNRIKSHKYGEVVDLLNSNKYNHKLSIGLLIQALTESYIETRDVENILLCLREIAKYPKGYINFGDLQSTNDVYGQFILSVMFAKQSEFESLIIPILEGMNKEKVTMLYSIADVIRDRIILSDSNDRLLKSVSADQIRESQTKYFKMDDLAKPRKDMTAEELEQSIIEYSSKGLNITELMRNLLLAYCKRAKFENTELSKQTESRVSDIIEHLKNNGVEFTNNMNNAIFDFFVMSGNIEKTEEALRQITDDFRLLPYKIFNLAQLYVKNGDLNKVKDLLVAENEKRKTINVNLKNETNKINRRLESQHSDLKLSALLTQVVVLTKDPKAVKEIFNLGLELSGMNVTKLMAQSLVRVYLINEDYSSALAEYIECYNSYRCLPLKKELMKAFLEKSDSSSLQTVIDLSNTLHGKMSTLVDLATAYIDVGKIKQAKKLMETPGLRVTQMTFDFISQDYITRGKYDQFETFVQITKNMFDIDREHLYYNLIKAYIKENSVNKALNVWTTMQDENIEPSDKTLRLLSEFLQQNNVKVPFETPPPIFPSEEDVDSSLSKEKSTFGQEKYMLTQLNNALGRGSLDKAIDIKNIIESRGDSVFLTQNCAIMGSLLESDRVNEAFDIANTLLQNKLYPSPRVLRFLLSKLAAKGDIKLIEKLKNLLPSSIVETKLYTITLAIAYINAGKSEKFVDEIFPNLKPFPLGGLLAILNTRPDLEDRVLKIANHINAEQDNHFPLNMVWLYYMENERYDDAQQIYNSSPKFKEYLVFTPLLDKIKETKNITMAKKLIGITKMTPKTIGMVYSSLIEVYLELNDVYRAEAIITDVILPNNEMRVDIRTGNNVKLLDIKNINRSTLIRLSNAIRAEFREPKFKIPKRVLNNASKEKEEENGLVSEEEANGV